jgi:hypothetical protein
MTVHTKILTPSTGAAAKVLAINQRFLRQLLALMSLFRDLLAVRDHPAQHKTNHKGTGEGGLGEHWELLQHKAAVLALAVLAVTPLRQ